VHSRPTMSVSPSLGLGAALWMGFSVTAAAAPLSGSHVYMHSGCFACHGQLGYGGAGPGFRGDKMLAANDYVIARILLGGGIMPAFAGTLSDLEIAAVASYIRNSWGNQFGVVSPDEVAKARKVLNSNASLTAPRPQRPTP
jgi:mono/diheme cytochrome c family protein